MGRLKVESITVGGSLERSLAGKTPEIPAFARNVAEEVRKAMAGQELFGKDLGINWGDEGGRKARVSFPEPESEDAAKKPAKKPAKKAAPKKAAPKKGTKKARGSPK